MGPKQMFDLLKQTFVEWNEDKAPQLGAALSYYTVFSLAPLLVVIIAIAGLVFGQQAASGQLISQIQELVGQQGAEAIQSMIQNASKPSSGIIGSVLGIATLLLGASGVFGQLKDALNTIWDVKPKTGRGLMGTIKGRFLSFSALIGTGFLLLVSLVISSFLAAFNGMLNSFFPGLSFILGIVNFVVSFLIVTGVFALLFKYFPDVKIAWSDVWIGAAFTAILFVIGKEALGIYLGQSSTASAYGAAASLAVIFLWVYYAAQILFFGAEFTQVYARRHGSQIEPSEDAEFTSDAPEATGASAGEGENKSQEGEPVGAGRVASSYIVSPNQLANRRAGMVSADGQPLLPLGKHRQIQSKLETTPEGENVVVREVVTEVNRVEKAHFVAVFLALAFGLLVGAFRPDNQRGRKS